MIHCTYQFLYDSGKKEKIVGFKLQEAFATDALAAKYAKFHGMQTPADLKDKIYNAYITIKEV